MEALYLNDSNREFYLNAKSPTQVGKMLLIYVFSFLLMFDAHFANFFELKNFVLTEIIQVCIIIYLYVRVLIRKKVKPFLLENFLLTILIVVVGTFKNGFIVSAIGTFYIFKCLFAFQGGYAFHFSRHQINNLFHFVLVISIVSGIFSVLQLLIKDLFINNPFNFPIMKNTLEERGKGIFSHPNKNGQILLYGAILSLYLFKDVRKKFLGYISLVILSKVKNGVSLFMISILFSAWLLPILLLNLRS